MKEETALAPAAPIEETRAIPLGLLLGCWQFPSLGLAVGGLLKFKEEVPLLRARAAPVAVAPRNLKPVIPHPPQLQGMPTLSWEVPEGRDDGTGTSGGDKLMLRLYDVNWPSPLAPLLPDPIAQLIV